MLFAKSLTEVSSLHSKAVRIILFCGSSRIETLKEQGGDRGMLPDLRV